MVSTKEMVDLETSLQGTLLVNVSLSLLGLRMDSQMVLLDGMFRGFWWWWARWQ
jgi:hypothetical protein